MWKAGCVTPPWTCVPSAKSSTRVISVVNPAGPLGGLGVKALAPVALPVTAWVPSRTSDGADCTGGIDLDAGGETDIA